MSKEGSSSELSARIIPLATLPAPSRGLDPIVQTMSATTAQNPKLLRDHFADERALILLSHEGQGMLFLDAAQFDRSHRQETETVSLNLSDSPEVLIVTVRKTPLLTQIPALSGLPPVTFETRSGPGCFLRMTCDLMAQDTLNNCSVHTRNRLTKHLADLLLTTLLDVLDLDLSATGRRRHRQKHIRAYIEMRLHELDLTPHTIAKAYGISARALYLLFDGEPGAVAGWILNRRLERIQQDLQSPEFASMTIAEVALRHGFRNAAHFSRRFRQKFGVSPRDVRPKRLHY